ncbi:MAG: HEAT repeat domain-containing protein [Verrucomicrobiia bacterium]
MNENTHSTDSAFNTASSDVAELNELLQKIKDADDKVRADAAEKLINRGPAAVQPLVNTMEDKNFEIARSAKRALWKMVRYSGKPGADSNREKICDQLFKALELKLSVQTKRELLWMLSEIGGDDAVSQISKYFNNNDLKEDARCCVERIPSEKAISALQTAFKKADEEFKYALAESLRARGVKIEGYQSKKLIPTRQTNIGK